MATDAQVIANQANAKKSTGPTSPEGKARSSQNHTTHGLARRDFFFMPGEDPAEFYEMLQHLTVDHLPSTALESRLVRTIAESQWRIDRILDWETQIMDEGLEGDFENPSTLLSTLSKSGEPSEALDRLHRYEALYRRIQNNAIKELRAQKSARHRANTVEASTTLRDIEKAIATAKKVAEQLGLEIPPVEDEIEKDNSNPISTPQPDAALPPEPAQAEN
jgi:hypothetical protein